MLKLKPNCEWCDTDLPPNASDAMICTYECTFCENCVTTLFENVCPNCGGGLSRRPIRPQQAYREGVSLTFQPASTERVHSKLSEDQVRDFTNSIKHIEPKVR